MAPRSCVHRALAAPAPIPLLGFPLLRVERARFAGFWLLLVIAGGGTDARGMILGLGAAGLVVGYACVIAADWCIARCSASASSAPGRREPRRIGGTHEGAGIAPDPRPFVVPPRTGYGCTGAVGTR
jgi:hypothetical protein